MRTHCRWGGAGCLPQILRSSIHLTHIYQMPYIPALFVMQWSMRQRALLEVRENMNTEPNNVLWKANLKETEQASIIGSGHGVVPEDL